MKKENVEQDELDKIIKALAHPVRRKVIEELASEGSLSYKELMDRTGVEDSGTFGFHLRNLRGFVVKNERGEYQLTELGWKAYEVLKILKGRVEEKPKPKEEEVKKEEEKWRIRVIEDHISFILTKNMLEKLKNEKSKLHIRDVIKLIIEEDVPRELFDEVVEYIEDVTIVYTPKELIDLIQLKSRDVTTIRLIDKLKKKEHHPLEEELDKTITSSLRGIISAISSGILSIIPSIASEIIESLSFISKRMKLVYSGPIELDNASKISIKSTASAFTIKILRDIDKPQLSIWSRDRECIWDYEVREVNGVKCLFFNSKRCKVELKLPAQNIKEVAIRANASAINLEGEESLRAIDLDTTSCSLSMNLRRVLLEKLSIRGTSSAMKAEVSYREFEGESIINTDVTSSAVNIKLSVPVSTSIYALCENGYSCAGTIEVDGEKHLYYKDPDYDKSKSKLRVRLQCKTSAVKISVTRVKT